MATWKSVQDSIKQSMKQLGELYEAQAQERKDFQVAVQNQAKEQLAQIQNQLLQYKKNNEELRKEVARLTEALAQRDVYIQGLEENVAQEDLDDTFPMPISNAFQEITQEDSLGDTLLEAEKREEEARAAKEAEQLLAAQKEKERAYQQKRAQEQEQQRLQQQKLQRQRREQEERARQEREKQELQAQKEHKRVQERNAALAQLEKDFAEASAKLSLAQKERESDSSLADLHGRFDLAKNQVLQRLPSLQKEYEEAKKSLQESSEREIDALSVDGPSGESDEREQSAKSELASLESKIEEIDTQLNGFFVRNRKRLEQEREAHTQRIDELNTLILYLRNQKNQASNDPRSSEKIEEIHRRMNMFEQQWQARLSDVQREVDNELSSLDQQFKKEEAAISKRLDAKIQKLQDHKQAIEKQIEQYS